jgi:beta propeller repeat protein
MRHARFLPLALAGLAACADAVTTPEPPTPSASLRASAAAGGGAVIVSDPQLVAWNEGGLRYGQNLPLAELGGGRVVWQDASSGAAAVLGYDLATRARTQYATVAGNFAWPVTEGRWVAWSDQGGTIYLRDASTGSVRTIGPGAGYSVRISPEGRVAFLEFGAGVGNVAVYDAATGETRVLTHYSPSTAEAARDVDVDGTLVTWSTFTQRSPYTTGIRVLDLATGVEREVVHVNEQAIGAPAVSAGRVAWSDTRSGNYDVYVYDVASGTTRQVTTDPAGQFNVRISGNYVVWEDTRNSTSPYAADNDIYLYDLASGTEMPVATGENHQGWPRVDGNRVLWTERANDRWEIRTAVLEAVTLESLSATVARMLATGEIGNRGAAESLQAFIAQAARARDAGDAAGERAALERFAAQLRRLAGKQIGAAAAGRLSTVASALLRSLS